MLPIGLLCIFITVLKTIQASRFTFPENFEINTPTTSVLWGPQTFNISEKEIFYVENGCKEMKKSSNKIFAIRGQWCSFETQAKNAQNAGAVAVLWISDRTSWHFFKSFREIEMPGAFAFSQSGEDTTNIIIPFV
ncbi:hypothetical protein HK096_011322, partial [Nowakowskiella sp. JEL0078]